MAKSIVRIESTHCFGAALSDSVGIIDVNVDVGAGSCASHDVGIPHAARIRKTILLFSVHDRAVTNTAESGSVPSAERRTNAIRWVADGEATDTADCGLGVPFTFAVSITLIRSGAEFALEFADTSDTIGNTVVTFITIADVGALSIADLLDGVPDASSRFRAHGVFGDGRALGATDLISHTPFATFITLDVAREEVLVSLGASSITSVAKRTNGKVTQRIGEQFTGTVSLTFENIQSLTICLADTSVVVPQAVTSRCISVAIRFFEEGVLTLILAE